MNLSTRDGKFFIDGQDYEILHGLYKRLPGYMKTAEFMMKAVDFQVGHLKDRLSTLKKFRRELGEVFDVFKKLNQKPESGNGKNNNTNS